MQTPTHPDLADFLDEMGWESSTLTVATSNLCRWERWLTGRGTPMWEATHRDLKAFLDERETAGIGGATRHKDWQNVTALYAWAGRPVGERDASGRSGAGLLAANPMLRCPAPKVVASVLRTAEAVDATAIVAYFTALAARRYAGGQAERARRNAAVVALMFRSGVRSHEVGGLDYDDVIRDEQGHPRYVRLRAEVTKSKRERMLPLTDEVPVLLARYLRLRGTEPGPLFLARAAHVPSRRLSAKAVQQFVARGAERCGLKLSAHDFRRGFAVAAEAKGIDRGHIKLVAGWSNDAMLNRYLGPSAARLAADGFHAAS